VDSPCIEPTRLHDFNSSLREGPTEFKDLTIACCSCTFGPGHYAGPAFREVHHSLLRECGTCSVYAMALLTEQRLLAKAHQRAGPLQKSAARLLTEEAQAPLNARFDIFLSHSIEDARIVLGAKKDLEDAGLTSYVDWISDPQMSRKNVTSATAMKLRLRMRNCRSLFYLHSCNSQVSIWMPWELGFFDGFAGRVAILPFAKGRSTGFRGREYLGVYPYVDVAQNQDGIECFWVNRSTSEYTDLSKWLRNPDAIRKH